MTLADFYAAAHLFMPRLHIGRGLDALAVVKDWLRPRSNPARPCRPLLADSSARLSPRRSIYTDLDF